MISIDTFKPSRTTSLPLSPDNPQATDMSESLWDWPQAAGANVQTTQVRTSQEALEQVRDTTEKLSSENQDLKAQLDRERTVRKWQETSSELELTELRKTNNLHLRLTKHIAQLAEKYHGNDICISGFYLYPLFQDVDLWDEEDEKKWFDWAARELKFAEEVRMAYGRIDQPDLNDNEGIELAEAAATSRAEGMRDSGRGRDEVEPSFGDGSTERVGLVRQDGDVGVVDEDYDEDYEQALFDAWDTL